MVVGGGGALVLNSFMPNLFFAHLKLTNPFEFKGCWVVIYNLFSYLQFHPNDKQLSVIKL